jgi:dipeptidyl aminopeptidase/acylaminoacyl peptidase
VLGADGLVLRRRAEPFVHDVAWSPRGDRIAVVRRTSDSSDVRVVDPAGRARDRELFSGPGAFGRVAFSPDGRRLLLPWPEADQWLFVSSGRGGHVGAVANIGRQFAPDRRRGPFPDVVEWCCAGS